MGDFDSYYKHCELYGRYVKALKEQSKQKYPDKIQELSDLRKISVQTLEQAGTFYIGNMAEMLLPEFFDHIGEFGVISETNGKPIFEGRWVFPISDFCGNVTNLVGYKRDAEVRYLYGTGKYYSRSDDFYGAEDLRTIYKMGWGILVEGITDRLAVVDSGHRNCLATCGTGNSSIKMTQLARVKYGIIFIHDRDSAGDSTRKHWVVPRGVRVNIVSGDKDIDAYLHSNNDAQEIASRAQEFESVIASCVDFLKKGVCLGGDIKHPIIESITLA